MTTAETKTFEAALRAKRQELVRTIRDSAAELTIKGCEAELIDHVQGAVGRDMTAMMLNRFSSTLEEVDRSLEAIAEGSYGVCAMCEEPIGIRRLQTLPWAAYCIRCQEQIETLREQTEEFDCFERRVA